MNTLGDRMKAYEYVNTHYLTRKVPVIIRVDGKAFHSWVSNNNIEYPYSFRLEQAMDIAAVHTAQLIQGFKLAYIASDEASFLLSDLDTLQTDAWFGFNQAKLVSVTASLFTGHFNWWLSDKNYNLAFFDARAFSIPEDDIANYFLWRVRDWERNSLHMYARQFFSHQELLGKDANTIHEMLHQKGKNWVTDTEVRDRSRNGCFIILGDKHEHLVPEYRMSYDSIQQLIGKLRVTEQKDK